MVHEHFFKKGSLLQLGCCSHYKTDSSIMHYPHPIINKIVKTSIVEFYWLNCSKNRFYKQETLTKVSIFNCTICKFLELKNKKLGLEMKNLFYLVIFLHCFIFTGIIIVIECNSG